MVNRDFFKSGINRNSNQTNVHKIRNINHCINCGHTNTLQVISDMVRIYRISNIIISGGIRNIPHRTFCDNRNITVFLPRACKRNRKKVLLAINDWGDYHSNSGDLPYWFILIKTLSYWGYNPSFFYFRISGCGFYHPCINIHYNPQLVSSP